MMNRQPAGIATGGQFATDSRRRSLVTLINGADPLSQPTRPEDWVGYDMPRAAEFERLGFTAETAFEWDRGAFTPADAYAWSRTEHVNTAEAAAEWRVFSADPSTADTWAAEGFSAAEAAPLIPNMAAHIAKTWRGQDKPEGWHTWAAAGFSATEHQSFLRCGFTEPAEAATWRNLGLSAGQAYGWKSYNFDAEQAEFWTRHGYFAFEARDWISDGHPLPVDESPDAPPEEEPLH